MTFKYLKILDYCPKYSDIFCICRVKWNKSKIWGQEFTHPERFRQKLRLVKSIPGQRWNVFYPTLNPFSGRTQKNEATAITSLGYSNSRLCCGRLVRFARRKEKVSVAEHARLIWRMDTGNFSREPFACKPLKLKSAHTKRTYRLPDRVTRLGEFLPLLGDFFGGHFLKITIVKWPQF
jgi:hypothetical protein